jgi:ribonuclease HII
MLTNQETGVSDQLDAESIFAQMSETDDTRPEETEGTEVQAVEDDTEEVEWDGNKYKIPKAIKPGLMFQSDYTKKTQALSEQRKAFEQHEQAVQAERQYYANQLKGFVQQLSQTIQQGPTEEQLVELSRTDPMAYIKAKADRDARMLQLQQAQYQQQQVLQQQEADQRRKFEDWKANERNTLMSKLPEWKDESAAKREIDEMSAYAQSIGYQPQELSELYDHRAYLVLRDAMRYRQLKASQQNQSKQTQAQPPTVLKPGAAPSIDEKKIPDTLVKTFNKAPTIENMAKIFERL